MIDEGGGASRSTEPAAGSSAATDVSLREHLASRLHDAEKRIDERDRLIREADARFDAERDRRYTEVGIEREKALAIKERADETARVLVAENQAYRDEKANELREQISSERGRYLTREEYVAAQNALIDKVETGLKPLNEYVNAQQGGPRAITTAMLFGAVGLVASLIVAAVLVATYLSTH